MLIVALVTVFVGGCALADLRKPPLLEELTRTEVDRYTITTLDTTYQVELRNAPGERGVIYPSDRTITKTHKLEQRDSTTERTYPNFIRFGVFETAGLIGTAPLSRGVGGGIFGIYNDPNESLGSQIRPKDALFTGSFQRYLTLEMPLYWFDSEPTWSIGTSFLEVIQLEASNDRTVAGLFPLYLRKRWYLYDGVPSVCLTGAAGFAVQYFPIYASTSDGEFSSQYLHLSGSLDVGSVGGLNFRSTVGLLIARSIRQQSLVQPYIGMNISVLDFLNHPRELRRQWHEQKSSAWNIAAARLTWFILLSGATANAGQASIGFQIQLAPTTIALPLLNNRLCAGLDLFNFVFAFREQQPVQDRVGFGYGVLPVRVGYWLPFGDSPIALESFVMYSYFPHTIWQLATTLHIGVFERLPLGVTIGYIKSNGLDVNRGTIFDIVDGDILDFSVAYLGISVSPLEVLFRPSQLLYQPPNQ